MYNSPYRKVNYYSKNIYPEPLNRFWKGECLGYNAKSNLFEEARGMDFSNLAEKTLKDLDRLNIFSETFKHYDGKK